ncbi:MAG: xylulokinase [Clostridia bacterium]|nr:xylulokinase [Clostridia bacterium]
MNAYIGIDLGTSGVKLLFVDAKGTILAENTQNYPVSYPEAGWSEQSPELWLKAVKIGVKELLKGGDRSAVKGISFGGQMHGLVILDKNDEVIRPCILWNDGRTERETAYLNDVVGKENLFKYTGNIAFAGFTAPKILWLKQNEPENFEKIAKIMLPKDYLAYMFTGEFCTDYSDASGTLLLDVENRKWSRQMCDICGICEGQLPKLCESFSPVGVIKEAVAKDLGLPKNTVVAIGAGDNAAAAVGTGATGGGKANISLGTSGTLFVSSQKCIKDNSYALHSFCHADGGWHLLGCILSAASCNSWWMSLIGADDYDAEQKGLELLLGENDVYFLPYLTGERCPHNDVNARGCFIGLNINTTRAQMTLAVLEGVAFAIRDCLERAKSCGVSVERATLCGGGAKSPLWRKIMADVTGIPIDIPQTEQGPAYGAAMLAMVCCGEYPDAQSAADNLIKIKETIYPDKTISQKYKKKYQNFRAMYPALKDVFKNHIQ